MAINRTGAFFEDPAFGAYIYGDEGVGSLTVDGGSQLDLAASDVEDSGYLGVGIGAAGNGAISIAGANSRLRMSSSGTGNEVGGHIGSDGGTGSMSITAGGRFEIIDNDTTPIPSNFAGSEHFSVGRNAGSNGTLSVNAGTFSMVGGAPSLHIGRDGGTGTATFSNGSLLSLQSVSSVPDPDLGGDLRIRIGRGTDANGTLTLDNSTGMLTCNPALASSEVGIQIGRDGGTGEMNLLNGSTFSMQGGTWGAYAQIGRGFGGNGTLNIDASTLSMDGVTGDASVQVGTQGGIGILTISSGSTVTANGANEAGFNVGRDGGAGVLNVLSGSTLTVTGAAVEAWAFIGRDAGSYGEVNVNASTVVFDSVNGGGFLTLGRAGGTGVMNIVDGSAFTLSGADWVGFEAGRDAGGDGTLTVGTSSSLTLNSGGNAFFGIGTLAQLAEGGNGEAYFDAATLTINAAEFADLAVGAGDGSTGLLDFTDSTATMDGGISSTVRVGADFGDGQMLLTSSSLAVTGNDGIGMEIGTNNGFGNLLIDDASLTLGADVSQLFIGYEGGDGSATLTHDATLLLSGANLAALHVGGNGGDGELLIRTGSGISFSGSVQMFIGYSGGEGSVVVDGGSVTFDGGMNGNTMRIGTFFDNNAADAGDGSLTVQRGGKVEFVGSGFGDFTVGGGAGSNGNVLVRSGGLIDVSRDTADNNGSIVIGGVEAGATGSLTIDGYGSRVIGAEFVKVGRNMSDVNQTSASTGTLTLTNLGTIGDGGINVEVGEGGTLRGRNGVVRGNVELEGGVIDMRDGLFGDMDITGHFEVLGTGSALFLDAGVGGNDRLDIGSSGLVINGDLDITVAPTAGYDFAAGEQRILAKTTGGAVVSGSITAEVLGQHADFSSFVGFLAGSNNIVLEALNSGASGGHAILDFGASSGVGAVLDYDAANGNGFVLGGRFSAQGGYADNVDEFRGTDLDDSLQVTVAGSRSFKIDGRGGDDLIQGGAGNDTLNGGGGGDNMTGGLGNDIYIVASAGDSTIENANGGTDTVRSYINWTLANNVERLELQGSSNLNGTGNTLANTLLGTSGNNGLNGGDGNDYIVGGAGNDILTGGAGNDRLIGGAGRDSLNGGTGNDVFDFDLVSDSPVGPALRDSIIGGFSHGSDRIDLATIDANTVVGGNQAFSFIGSAAFTGVAGQLRYTNYSGTVIINADVNGDSTADMQILVAGTHWMTGTDFIV